MIYQFENYTLDTQSLTLKQNGIVQKTEPQVFALLALLVSQHKRTVSKKEINQHVWKGRIVSDAALNSRIRSARIAIGDNGSDQRIIKTIPNIGLRFVSPVTEWAPETQSQKPWKNRYRATLMTATISAFLIGIVGTVTIYNSDSFGTSASEDMNAQVTIAKPIHPDAILAYEKGQSLKEKNTRQSLDLAEQEFSKSVGIDPSFGDGFAALADLHRYKYYAQNVSFGDTIASMDRNLALALKASPRSTKVLDVAASVSLFNRQYEQALVYAKRAIAADGTNAEAYNRLAYALSYLGRYDESLAAHEKAVSLAPASALYLNDLAWTQYAMGETDTAMETASKNESLNPERSLALELSTYTAWNQGNYGRYHALLHQAISNNPEDKSAIGELLWLYSNIGLGERSRSIVNSEDEIALLEALSGNYDKAAKMRSPDEFGYGADFLPYLSGNFELAASLLKDEIAAYKFAVDLPVSDGDGYWYARACFVLRKMREPDADKVCESLVTYYLGKGPADYKMAFDHLGGIGWHLINNDIQSAMAWLDHMIDNDHAFINLTVEPLYEALESRPEYAGRLRLMEHNAQRHRASILPQLTEEPVETLSGG